MAASHAEVHAKPFLVIHKFMQSPLPPPSVLYRAGIMSSGHQREISVVAGIVTLVTNPCVFDFLIGDLETMTGGADKSTGVAADTVEGNGLEFR
jgi:hypothetical protein